MLSKNVANTQIEKQLVDLRARERVISQNTKSTATKTAYRADWKKFCEWCESVEFVTLPADPDTVRLYVVWLDKIGRKPSTIRRAITSIRQAHAFGAYACPITEAVKETCKGIFRMRGVIQTKKSALTLDKLRRVLSFVPKNYIGIRDRALILTGWTGALRRAEIVNIDLEDIEHESEGLVITIRRSKTDQVGAGRKIGLPFVDADRDCCAARNLTEWVIHSNIKGGPVFRAVGKSGKIDPISPGRALNDKQVSRIVKTYAARAGYNPNDFGGHSLRSGLATTLASVGIEERRIMQITGHKSLPILREYIQRAELFTDHPILTVFLG